MDQVTARKLAKEKQGVATQAKPRKGGGWTLGGWADKTSTWIVVLPDGTFISEPCQHDWTAWEFTALQNEVRACKKCGERQYD